MSDRLSIKQTVQSLTAIANRLAKWVLKLSQIRSFQNCKIFIWFLRHACKVLGWCCPKILYNILYFKALETIKVVAS